MLEPDLPGGQASHTSMIENFFGFPGGIGGAELARLAGRQAEGFGAELICSTASPVTATTASARSSPSKTAARSPHRWSWPRRGWRGDASTSKASASCSVAASTTAPGAEWDPLALETSVRGFFAAGDVWHGSAKRVAAAVGEGAMAVALAHLRFEELEGLR